MRRNAKIGIGGAVAAAIMVAGAFGFAVDRPTLYHAEFLPVADDVKELTVENTWDKWQRASEQVQVREETIKFNGGEATSREREELIYWKKMLKLQTKIIQKKILSF